LSATRGTLRRISTGTSSRKPISQHFSITRAMARLFTSATPRVTATFGSRSTCSRLRISIFARARSTRSTTPMHSMPLPSKTATSSPTVTRSTRLRWRASAPSSHTWSSPPMRSM